jgi:hypothetical protein
MLREEISRNANMEISLVYLSKKKLEIPQKNLEFSNCSIGAAALRFAFLEKFKSQEFF